MSMSNSEKTVKDIPRTTDILLLSIYAPLRTQRFSALRCDKYGGNSANSRYTGSNRTLT